METNPTINNSSSSSPSPSTINSPSKPPKPYTSTSSSPVEESTLSNPSRQLCLSDLIDQYDIYWKKLRLLRVINQNDDEYWKNFPVGYRFHPRDGELIAYYLKPKVLSQPLPRNKIVVVNIYLFNPEQLAENYKAYKEDDAYYFFTPRDRKYKNGDRPSRAAGSGYWKATGANKPVYHQNERVGSRNALVFYRGKPPHGVKTDWIMHEFKVDNPPPTKRTGVNDMRLDDWVLCKIYFKPGRTCKVRAPEDEDHHQQAENESMTSMLAASTPAQYDHGIDPQRFRNSPIIGGGETLISGGGGDVMVDHVSEQIQAVSEGKKNKEMMMMGVESQPYIYDQDDHCWSSMNPDNNYNYGTLMKPDNNCKYGTYGEMIYSPNNYVHPFDTAMMSFCDPISEDNLSTDDVLHNT